MRRRLFLPCGVVLLSLLVSQYLLVWSASTAQAHEKTEQNLVQYVNPFVGTANGDSPAPLQLGAAGSTYPGATVPFGMVQFSPDTPNADPSGYTYSDTTVKDFSLTHFDGAGCPNNDDLPILPVTGTLSKSPGTNWSAYSATFSKSNESATPGYYKTKLDTYNTQVELTATTRTGMARFTYPSTSQSTVLINAGLNATGNRSGSLQISGNTVTGSATAGGFCSSKSTYQLYFAIQFDQTPTAVGTWSGSTISAGKTSVSGTSSGGYLTFDTRSNPVVQMKVAISYVSIANAQQNMASENNAWDFSAIQQAASTTWNTILNRVQVSGDSENDLTEFYTALYHVFQSPNIASDINGQYEGFDKKVHTASDMNVYQNYSGWDVYRSWAALMALIAPNEMTDIVKSMILDGEQGGELPKWSEESNEIFEMTGDPGPIIVSSAYAFGVRDFDTTEAFTLMNNSASNVNATTQGAPIRSQLSSYLSQHYIAGNPSVSLEYSASDFAIAQFAQALGNSSSYNTYMTRAQWWQNVFNPTVSYVTPRNSNGSWSLPLNPKSNSNFTEGNAAQYTWDIPYNAQGLINLVGGNATAIQRLNFLFKQVNAGITQPYFYIGNEPEFSTPWMYTYASDPAGTQAAVRKVVNEAFTDDPGGLPGNDDLGATSAWLVWADLGLYPTTPGADTLVLQGPRFASETVQLANDQVLQINGNGANGANPYVQSLSVNGVASDQDWLTYSDIANGATLDFTMGSTASSWGAAGTPPPSFTDGAAQTTAAPDLGTNLALYRSTTGSTTCNSVELASKAVDGDLSNDSKWCSKKSPASLAVDLGSPQTVGTLVVKTSALGGESSALNISAYTIQVSNDNKNWSTVMSVNGNQASRAVHAITPRAARYVRINVTKPDSISTDTASRIYEFEVYSANGVASSFSSGFESSDPHLSWTNSADNSGYPAGALRNVGGICCSLTGPETGTRTGQAHSGSVSMLYSGMAKSAASDVAYMKIFDLSAKNVAVNSSTTLSYWIYPQSSLQFAQVHGHNSACVAIDLIFSDGTNLRDSGLTDQNGNRAHPAYQCTHLTLNTWNHVTVKLGALANGKTITRIDFGYDQPKSSGGYRGYLDDVSIQ